jgi:hypothetical protein
MDEVALQVAVPAPVGVKKPVDVMVPPVAVQVTAVLNVPVPRTVAAHCDVCPVLMEDGDALTETEVMVNGTIGAVADITAIGALLDLVVSCTEVAVQVPVPVEDGTNTPLCEIVPPVAVQVTSVLKFPCPETVAIHVDVCPMRMGDGVALTATAITELP